MSSSTFIGLVNNSAFLVTLVLIYDVTVVRHPGERATLGQIPLGVLLGIIGIFIMMNPWELVSGIIFDTRTVLLCISGLFFGTLPTLIAAVMLAGYRLFLGGDGVMAGLAAILTAGGIGLLWRHVQKKSLQEIQWVELYMLGLITHVFMLICLFIMPLPTAIEVVKKIGLPVILIMPLVTLLIGKLMTNRLNRLKAVEALKESDNKYSTIFSDHAAVKLLIEPETGRIIDANTAAGSFYGWSRDQLCRMAIEEINTLSAEQIQEEIKKASSRQRNFFEFQHRLADGSLRDVEIYSSAVVINNKTYLHSIIHDVTARKQAESQLQETQTILQAAMDNSPAGIAIADAPSGALRYVNSAGLLVYGGDRSDLVRGVEINTSISSWQICNLDGTLLKTEEGPLARAVLFGEKCSREFIVRRKENDDLIVLANAAPITNGGGKVTAGIVIYLDITERKKVEQELVRQKKLFETMFNRIPDGVVITDTERKIVLANSGMQTTFGYSPEKLLGKTTSLLYANSEEFSRAGKAVFNEESSQEENLYITRYKKSSGEEFPGESYGAKLCDENGEWLGNLGVMRDVSTRLQQEQERIDLQKQLMQAQKMEAIGTLAGGIAHDFNNILAVILGYAQMANEASPRGSLLASDTEQILTAGYRARDLVKQILAFSRESKTELVPVQPTKIMKEIIKLLRSSLPSTITIEQNISSTEQILAYSSTRIHQIIMNLCTNAYHALEETGGTLTLHLDQVAVSQEEVREHQHIVPGSFIHLAVIDDGPGIPAEIRDKIFEPYFTTKEVGKGTGMGLAIVHGIVSDYGGFIHCESELGQGTAFHLYLPAAAAEATAEKAEGELISAGSEHILFIDDEPALAEMNKVMLNRLGYTVTVRTSSIEALATFENQADDFDLVITDQTMPGMTGFDLAGRMLQLRPEMPIILCTGFSSIISREKVLAAGIRGFAEKPLVKSEIGALIRQALQGTSPSPAEHCFLERT